MLRRIGRTGKASHLDRDIRYSIHEDPDEISCVPAIRLTRLWTGIGARSAGRLHLLWATEARRERCHHPVERGARSIPATRAMSGDEGDDRRMSGLGEGSQATSGGLRLRLGDEHAVAAAGNQVLRAEYERAVQGSLGANGLYVRARSG